MQVTSFITCSASRILAAGVAIIVLACCAAPAPEASERCTTRVIVSFSPQVTDPPQADATAVPPPDAKVVEAVADAAGVRLSYLRAITTNLFVFELSASSPESDCEVLLERLRHDPRVRSVDRDRLRKHH